VLDMGRWWRGRTGLPIPLGLDVVRKDLGRAQARQRRRVSQKTASSWPIGKKNSPFKYALKYGRGIDAAVGEKFVKMYVNRDTLDLGPEGERALRTLFRLAWARRLIPAYPDFKILRP
jgi:1,4-dihydroxy-6-naphthoate synthase